MSAFLNIAFCSGGSPLHSIAISKLNGSDLYTVCVFVFFRARISVFISRAPICCHFACSLMMIQALCVLLLVRFSFGGCSIQTCIVSRFSHRFADAQSPFYRESAASPLLLAVSLLLSAGRASSEAVRTRASREIRYYHIRGRNEQSGSRKRKRTGKRRFVCFGLFFSC